MSPSQEPKPTDVTMLLQAWQAGDEQALDQLVPAIYEELHRISSSFLKRERSDHTLQATALVNEAYMKLVEHHKASWQSRAHFLSVAAQTMRRILINHWRERNAQKRGGASPEVTLDEALMGFDSGQIDLEVLHESLEVLAKQEPRRARLVELKFFGGLKEEEMAEVLNVSVGTIRRDWKLARVWLFRYFKNQTPDS